MASPHNIIVIVGSIRKESYTLKIANALAKLAPDEQKACQALWAEVGRLLNQAKQ